MNPGVVIVVVVVLAALALVLVVRSRRANDTVASFRRQIDALSPEARRPVVDQVQSVAERGDGEPADDPADDPDDGAADDADEGDGGGADEGGPRGS